MTGILIRLRRAWQRRNQGVPPGPIVLLYHRVDELPTDPQALCVAPARFAAHLEVLRNHCTPVSLQELVDGIVAGGLPPRAVALTFDDGYADNLYKAKPLLERYGIPATVFVTAGFVGGHREFLWDELERLFLQPGALPQRLRLVLNGHSQEWDLGRTVRYTPEMYHRHRRWTMLYRDAPTARQELYRRVWLALRPLPSPERLTVLDDLHAQVGMEAAVRPTHQVMTAMEVRQLADGGLVEVGGHTLTHPMLSGLAESVQRTEIVSGKAHLEEILGHPVTSFSYPFGRKTDYTAATVRIIQDAGFRLSCANYPSAVRTGADVFQLPRFLVRDCDGDEFARRLEGWFVS
ncbi:MAG: polysaccharide deacetylase family protein [bacterium]